MNNNKILHVDDSNTVFFLFEFLGKDYYYSKVSWQVSVILNFRIHFCLCKLESKRHISILRPKQNILILVSPYYGFCNLPFKDETNNKQKKII